MMLTTGTRVGDTSGGRLFEAFLKPLDSVGLVVFRRLTASGARGRVLEVGAGTGANLRWYDGAVEALSLSDLKLAPLLSLRAGRLGLADPVEADVAALPFPDASFDTVVSTLLFCSVPDPAAGFAEIRRVLAPGGEWRFVEHVLPARSGMAAAFRRVAPAWRRVAGGCKLDRDTVAAIRAAGFEVELLGSGGGGALVAGVARPARALATPPASV